MKIKALLAAIVAGTFMVGVSGCASDGAPGLNCPKPIVYEKGMQYEKGVVEHYAQTADESKKVVKKYRHHGKKALKSKKVRKHHKKSAKKHHHKAKKVTAPVAEKAPVEKK